MFLHLGRDVAVAEDSIIVVFDMDTATWSRHTRNYLTAAEKAGKVYVITDELPKSAVVCRENGDFVVVSFARFQIPKRLDLKVCISNDLICEI